MRVQFTSTTFLVIVVGFLTWVGCDSPQGPPETWSDASLGPDTRLFERRNGHPALAELDGLYLGQNRREAREILERYCGDDIVRRDGGAMGGNAYFLGCRIEENSALSFVRVGFWPRLKDRVATLEIKRPSAPPSAVYRAFLHHARAEPTKELLRDLSIRLELPNYRFYADWDQGVDGPTHLTVGFAPNISLRSIEGD